MVAFDDFSTFFVILGLLACGDHVMIKPLVSFHIRKRTDIKSARWFFVHSLANAFVCATSLHSMRAVVYDPVHAFDGSFYTDKDTGLFGKGSRWPLLTINAVHCYHMVGGFRLTPADYFHHGLFIPTIALPGSLYRWGPLANWQAFFMSGFPGGIDYFLLGLCKIGLCNHLLEKRVNANLNIWCRVPGVAISFVLCFQGIALGHSGAGLPADLRPPFWAQLLQLCLPIYNVLFFGKQSVANFSVHYMLSILGEDERIRKHIERLAAKENSTWRDALAVPQRAC